MMGAPTRSVRSRFSPTGGKGLQPPHLVSLPNREGPQTCKGLGAFPRSYDAESEPQGPARIPPRGALFSPYQCMARARKKAETGLSSTMRMGATVKDALSTKEHNRRRTRHACRGRAGTIDSGCGQAVAIACASASMLSMCARWPDLDEELGDPWPSGWNGSRSRRGRRARKMGYAAAHSIQAA